MIKKKDYLLKILFLFTLLFFCTAASITHTAATDGSYKTFFANRSTTITSDKLSDLKNEEIPFENDLSFYRFNVTELNTNAVEISVCDKNSYEENFLLALSDSAKKLLSKYSLTKQFTALLNFTDVDEAANFISKDTTKIYNAIARKNCVEFSESKFVCIDGKPKYISGKDGKYLDKREFCLNLFNAIDNGTYKVTLNFLDKKAESLNCLKMRTVQRGDFSTVYSSSNENRSGNIALATKKINGTVIMPDETFSFNETVGKRTAANGFKEAKVILDGEFTSGIGGGVCQVSTTLYNCALIAGLEITEANQHSLPVSYVAPSLDAMVSDYSDLKFKNNTGYPVYIFGYTQNKTVRFQIFGIKGKTLSVTSEISKILPFEKSLVYRPDATDGEIIREGKNGYESDAYLIYTENGMTVKRKIRHNVYKPQNELVSSKYDGLKSEETQRKEVTE